MKVGINGFGRIGKNIYKTLVDRNIPVTKINDPNLNLEYLVYTLKYDSTYGPSKRHIHTKNNKIYYGDHETELSFERDPSKINWHVDIVIEASGLFTKKEEAERHNAKMVLITAPSKDAPMFVYGVNHHNYNNEKVFSNASCTTNCLAPIVKVINENFGVKEGLMMTIHAATATQKVVDAATKKDWRSGRGVLQNIIPASTGAARAVSKVLPELEGKLTGMAMRVPIANVSVVDFTFKTEKRTSMKDIVARLRESVNEEMKGIIKITDEDVVSSDFNGCSHSSIVDVKASIELNERFFKIISWYDNEYGYCCRIADFVEYLRDR